VGILVRLRRVFIVAQVAVSLALLITAGLFFQSLTKAMRVDPGFEPRGAVTVSFDPDLQGAIHRPAAMHFSPTSSSVHRPCQAQYRRRSRAACP
jgi:hypothetical protein